MRFYSAADEGRIRAAAQVRAWSRSGLLTAPQGAAIEAELRTGLRRTNIYLRIALFIFGTIVVWAAVGLTLLMFDVKEDWAIAWTAIAAGVIDVALARFLVVQFQVYRFGVEEAVAVWSVALIALGAGFLTSIGSHTNSDRPLLVACVVVALGAVAVYRLFGYLYSACAASAAAAATSFFLGLPRFAEHLMAALILLAIFAVARALRRRNGDGFPGDDYGVVEAVAWAGCYVVLNLRLDLDFMPSFIGIGTDVPAAFYWATYVAIWLLPPIGLALALRDKHRPMIWSSLLMTIVTFVTSKPYLGWPRHTWDPILFGLLLAGCSLALRRWLLSGSGEHRYGYTPHSLMVSADRDAVGVLGSLAVAAQPLEARTPMTVGQSSPAFDAGQGGRSGGAGGGTDF